MAGIGTIELPKVEQAISDARRAPRRYSTDRSDPGYPPWKLLSDLGVWVSAYLDGVHQPDAETADEGEGMVVRVIRAADGQLQLTPGGDDLLRETVRGEVTFSFRTT